MIEDPTKLSLVMPCYNEAASIRTTVNDLLQAFSEASVPLQLVLVDNGSTDETGTIIDEFVSSSRGDVIKVHVLTNEGYGNGILRGLEHCSAPLVGFLHADGQIAPEDVVTVYQLMRGREQRILAKARRRFREDSWRRKIVSIFYNGLIVALFGWRGAIDVNGSPKILSLDNLRAMKLTSKDWFLDPEMILKAGKLGLRIIEIDVEGRSRYAGASHVRIKTCFEFLKNLVRYRLAGFDVQPPGAESGRSAGETLTLDEERRAPAGEARNGAGHAAGSEAAAHVAADPWERIRVLEQKRHEDERGALLKVLTASQSGGDIVRGEVYVTTAQPGEAKGNHYHLRMGEWFSVVQGEGTLELCDASSGQRRTIPLSSARPSAAYVPAGLAHAVVNRGDDVLICVACAEAEHDPTDVFPYSVWPQAVGKRDDVVVSAESAV